MDTWHTTRKTCNRIIYSSKAKPTSLTSKGFTSYQSLITKDYRFAFGADSKL